MNQVRCVICDSQVDPVLDLKKQPLANNLARSRDEEVRRFPLGLARCPNCTHGQLTYFVDPKWLFEDYLYASGTSKTLDNFFSWFAKSVDKKQVKDVLEIASNDGSHLTHLANEGFTVVGVDPAANLNAIASKAGHRVITGFFPDAAPPEQFDLIVAMNVAAHTPEPVKFIKGVAKHLRPNGVAIIQTSQALMLQNGEFDTIYHEHFSFYTVASMKALAEKGGLVLEDVRLTSVHGTSFLFFLRHPGRTEPVQFTGGAPFEVPWPVGKPAFLERNFGGAIADATYQTFVTKAQSLMVETRKLVEQHQSSGLKVALVGVAAKALTFVHAASIKPDYYFDEAPLKVGKFVPGSEGSIRSFGEIATLERGMVFFIGAWNFADEIMDKISKLYPHKARFIVHFPNLREID